MFDSGIYLIRNIVTEKVYVGSSLRLIPRLKEHHCLLTKGTHINPKLQNAWNKYGADSFEFEIVAFCPSNEVLTQEQLAINAFDSVRQGYNINPIANKPPSWKGKTKSKKHIGRISAALTGKNLTREHKEALKKGWIHRKALGLVRTSESYRQQSANTKGRKQSEEHSAKRAQTNQQVAKLQNPEWRKWIGRKSAALRYGYEFSEPAPPVRLTNLEKATSAS